MNKLCKWRRTNFHRQGGERRRGGLTATDDRTAYGGFGKQDAYLIS